MIRINLLPVREIVKRNRAKKQVQYSGILFFAFIFLLSAFVLYQKNHIDFIQEEVRKVEAEKKSYTAILDQIKKIDEEKKLIDTRIDVIRKLKKTSSLTVHLLDEVARVTHPSRMWLVSVDQNGDKLTMRGMALDDQTIAKYMDDLNSSKYIQKVDLANSSMQKFAERDLKSFEISCVVGFEQDAEKEK
ncbi:MAG: PilN domain-containing protein [Desulfobulbus sp.]|jgi:type IV pilus assembly protein PilN